MKDDASITDQGDQTELVLPVFYIGTPDAALKLQENGLDVTLIKPNSVHPDLELGSKHLLMIDGVDPVDIEFLKNEILDGNPVVALSHPEYLQDLIENEIESGLVSSPQVSSNTQSVFSVEEPMEAEESYDSELAQPKDEQLDLENDLDIDRNGSESEQTSFGIYRSNGASISFYSPETDLLQSALTAYKWAHDAVAAVTEKQKESELSPRTNQGMGRWDLQNQRTWFSKDSYKDRGRINITTAFYKLFEEKENTEFDYWLCEFKVEAVPGILIYDSPWSTANIIITFDADNGYPDFFLSDKSPTTTATSAGGSITVGLTLSGPSASKSWSYGGDGVKVYEKGDKSEGTAIWNHDVGWKSTGKTTYEARPGAIVRVPHGTKTPWTKWFEHYEVDWARSKGVVIPQQQIWGDALRWWPSIYSGYKTMTAKHSNKCIDVAGVSQSNEANVYQITCNGQKNQKWQPEPQLDGTYRIIAEHSKKCLDVYRSSTLSGANVQQYECNHLVNKDDDNQKWKIINRGNGYFSFQNKKSGKCLHVDGAGTADGTNLIQRSCQAKLDHQLFKRN
jgi:hypothetical protein